MLSGSGLAFRSNVFKMGGLPLLCLLTLSRRTLIWNTRPYSSKRVLSSDSLKCLGICPTNILIASGSGTSPGEKVSPFITLERKRRKIRYYEIRRELGTF
jgi:hypothetical protein